MSVSSFIVGGAPFYKLPGDAPGAPGMVLTSTGQNSVGWVSGGAALSAEYVEYTLDANFSPGVPIGEGDTATAWVAQTPVFIDGAAKTRVDFYIDDSTITGIVEGETEYYLQFRETIPGPLSGTLSNACTTTSTRGGTTSTQLTEYLFVDQGGGNEFLRVTCAPGVAGPALQSKDELQAFGLWYLSNDAPPAPPSPPDATQVELNKQAIAALEGEVSSIEAADVDRDDAILANTQAVAGLMTETDLLAEKQTAQQLEINANRSDIDFLLAQQPPANRYIFLNGTGGYLNFSGGGGDYLDFTKSWTVALSLEGLPDNPVDNHPLSCFGSGQVSLTLKRSGAPGSGNWGSFNSSNQNLYQTTGRFNANTWYAPGGASRVMWTFSHTEKRLAYWLQEVAGAAFARRAYIAVPDSAIAAQGLGNDLCFGKAWTGEGGALFQGDWWNGGVNSMICAKEVLTDSDIAELWQSGGEIEDMAVYAKLTSYVKLGEEAYPSIVDVKGTLTGGSLIGGSPADFRDITPA